MIFCLQDYPSSIAQVEYQSQTQYTRIIDYKPFINTCYHIECRLDLKDIHFAQFLLNGSQCSSDNSGDQVMDGWSVTQ